MQAALTGSREIGFTILSMTISLAAVFLPVLFMGGLLGRLLHEFAVTIGVAILVSGFVSLTLTPMLCSRFLKPHDDQKRGRFYEASERVFARWLAPLRPLAAARSCATPPPRWSSRLRSSSAPCCLFVVMPKGFLPSEDTGQMFAITEGAQGISFDGDGRTPEAGRRDRRRRPRGRGPQLERGRGRAERHDQRRPRLRPPQAPRRARRGRRP